MKREFTRCPRGVSDRKIPVDFSTGYVSPVNAASSMKRSLDSRRGQLGVYLRVPPAPYLEASPDKTVKKHTQNKSGHENVYTVALKRKSNEGKYHACYGRRDKQQDP